MAAQWFATDSGGAPAWALTDVETPASAADAPLAVAGDPTGGTTALISWTPASTGGVPSGFDVQLESPTGSGNWVAATGAANPTSAGAASFTAAGLSVVTSYTPRVRAKSTGFADSAWTVGLPFVTDNSVTGSAVIGSTDTTAPAFPNGAVIVITGLTATGYTATCAAATDAVGVTGYQWRIGGAGAWTDIIGGGRSVTITGRTPASTDALEMRARDSSNFSVPLATSITLLGIAPAVIAQPGNVSVADGFTATFTAAFSGTPTPALQWARNGAPISGATSASYSFTATLADTGAVFVCTATNSAGSTNSNAAVLTVTAAAVAPSIAVHPVTQTVASGSAVTFSVVANGSTPITYQWLRGGVAVPGATSASYSFTAAQLDSGVSFSVTASNSAGSVTSNAAVLSVTADAPAPAPAPPLTSTVPGVRTLPIQRTKFTLEGTKWVIEKDPSSTLDYDWPWTSWLSAVQDTIQTVTVSDFGGGITIGSGPQAPSHSNGVVKVWVSGGTVSRSQLAWVTVRITTVGGRVDERTAYLRIVEL